MQICIMGIFLFENCLEEYLAGIESDTDARFDTYTNKNIKYLFYRYNDPFVLSVKSR